MFSPCMRGFSGFLPPSKKHVRLTGVSNLSLGVSVSVCLCDLSRVNPASRPMTAGIGPTPPDPTDGLDGIENGWMDVKLI